MGKYIQTVEPSFQTEKLADKGLLAFEVSGGRECQVACLEYSHEQFQLLN
jgi:hypothetical protein